jgi:hypothetical protein
MDAYLLRRFPPPVATNAANTTTAAAVPGAPATPTPAPKEPLE